MIIKSYSFTQKKIRKCNVFRREPGQINAKGNLSQESKDTMRQKELTPMSEMLSKSKYFNDKEKMKTIPPQKVKTTFLRSQNQTGYTKSTEPK